MTSFSFLPVSFEYYCNKFPGLSQKICFQTVWSSCLSAGKQIVKDCTLIFNTNVLIESVRKKKLVIFVLTLNNYRAWEFIENHFEEEVLFCSFGSNQKLPREVVRVYPSLLDVLYGIMGVVEVVCVSLVKWRLPNRFMYLNRFDLVYSAFISERLSKVMCGLFPSSLFLFANDLNIPSRVLNSIARANGHLTVYLQHASVSDLFPVLNFDVALLEGVESRKHYKALEHVKIVLVGQPRFERYKAWRKVNTGLVNIGVAFNTLDDLSVVKNVIYTLTKLNYKVYLRSHPRELRVYDQLLVDTVRISTDESSFDFLNRIDALIVGDSSIALESVLMNVQTCYFNMNNGVVHDYYGYVKNHLIEEVMNTVELESFLLNMPLSTEVYKKAKQYCECLELDCNSEDLVVLELRKLLAIE
jgi:hypothetical protein